MARTLLMFVGLMLVLGFFFKALSFLVKFALLAGIIYLVVKALEKKKHTD